MKVEDIEDHFSLSPGWWGSFDCPNCGEAWGPSDYGDPPRDEEALVKCTCGQIMRVSGEWVSNYVIDMEAVEDE